MQRQKAEAAETRCIKLAADLKKEQAENATHSAVLKGTEKHFSDVLAQMDATKGMQNLLLQTLGDAGDRIQAGV